MSWCRSETVNIKHDIRCFRSFFSELTTIMERTQASMDAALKLDWTVKVTQCVLVTEG